MRSEECLDNDGVDLVIFGVRSDKTNKEDSCVVVDFYNESVVIALDVEDDAIAWKDISRWIGLLDCFLGGPLCFRSFMEPCT